MLPASGLSSSGKQHTTGQGKTQPASHYHIISNAGHPRADLAPLDPFSLKKTVAMVNAEMEKSHI
jgi:hypothetical protein